MQSIALEGATGQMPLEVRFKHNPDECHAFVGTALGSAIFHLHPEIEVSRPSSGAHVAPEPSGRRAKVQSATRRRDQAESGRRLDAAGGAGSRHRHNRFELVFLVFLLA